MRTTSRRSHEKVYGTSRRGATPGQRTFEMRSLDVTSDESVEAALAERWQDIAARGDQPSAVADVVLKAVDAAVRKNLQLDALTASLPAAKVAG